MNSAIVSQAGYANDAARPYDDDSDVDEGSAESDNRSDSSSSHSEAFFNFISKEEVLMELDDS